MYLLDLNLLRPGDLILVEGNVDVAAMTGGPFGHALVAVGRLLYVEADLEPGVTVSGFRPEVWMSGGRSVHAHPLAPAAAVPKVRRLATAKPIADIRGLAIGEIGRNYSMDVATEFPDLDPAARHYLLRKMTRRSRPPGPPDAPGRACSEVVAVILGLDETALSPNSLAKHADLVDVPSAVIDNRNGAWLRQRQGGGASEIDLALSKVKGGVAQDVYAAAKRIWASRQPPGRSPLEIEDVAPELDAAIGASMRTSIEAMDLLDRQAENLLR